MNRRFPTWCDWMIVFIGYALFVSVVVAIVTEPVVPKSQSAECVDEDSGEHESPAAYGDAGVQYEDPHDDPRWRATRRMEAKKNPRCAVLGCKDDPRGDAIHHGVSAEWCVRSGHYNLAVENGPGQKFYRLCENHHGPIGHGIGHGGSWKTFNVDIESDVLSGKWNSRGRSAWPFKSDDEVVCWVKSKVQSAKESR